MNMEYLWWRVKVSLLVFNIVVEKGLRFLLVVVINMLKGWRCRGAGVWRVKVLRVLATQCVIVSPDTVQLILSC